jgi:hypothetical protein
MNDAEADARIAWPGDPGLDCHLACLRLASIVRDPGFHAGGVLTFDTTEAGGWWISAGSSEKVYPDEVTSLDISFGVDMNGGHEAVAEAMMRRLAGWCAERRMIELTSAPGKWSLLRSGTEMVPVPRKEAGALT